MSTSTSATNLTARAAFSKRLKDLRDEKGLSQASLADKLGAGRTSIIAYEKEDTLPPIDVVRRAAEYFGVTCDYLLGLDEGQSKEHTSIIRRTNLSEKAAGALIEMDSRGEHVNSVNHNDFIRASDALSLILESGKGQEALDVITRLLALSDFQDEDDFVLIKELEQDKELFAAYMEEERELSWLPLFDALNIPSTMRDLTVTDFLHGCIGAMIRGTLDSIRNSPEMRARRLRSLKERWRLKYPDGINPAHVMGAEETA